MSKCWKCNKEFYSENLIRTLCDECLEKIPKTTATTDFGNLLNSEIKDLVDDFSKRKISELEAKLAEEKEYTQQYRKECAKIQTDYYELKQQLAEKEKEIESLRENSLSKRIFKEKLIPSHCMEQYEKYEQQIDKLTQDKISFAVEQLEKVKDYFIEGYAVCKNFSDFYWNFTEQIDNQINQLKEGK